MHCAASVGPRFFKRTVDHEALVTSQPCHPKLLEVLLKAAVLEDATAPFSADGRQSGGNKFQQRKQWNEPVGVWIQLQLCWLPSMSSLQQLRRSHGMCTSCMLGRRSTSFTGMYIFGGTSLVFSLHKSHQQRPCNGPGRAYPLVPGMVVFGMTKGGISREAVLLPMEQSGKSSWNPIHRIAH